MSKAIQRIESLLDEHSFVELGALVTSRSTDFNLNDRKAPSDGVVIGHGLIDDNLVFVFSQDASVLNGTIGEMHAKKILSVYDMAVKMGAPVIGLLDCAGLRLEEAADALHGFGQIYLAQTEASGVIPQITGIFGMCGGGMALIPALTDFTLMEEEGKLFVNSPNALAGNIDSKCDTASAAFQAEEAGLVDFAGSEEQVLAQMRRLFAQICGDFAAIPVQGEPKVRVGVVGEIYIKYSPLGNNNLEQFLLSEGAEPVVPGLTDFIIFKIYNREVDVNIYGGKWIKKKVCQLFKGYVEKCQKAMIAAMSKGGFRAPGTFEDLRRLIQGYLGEGNKMGEGWLLTAEMLELIHSGTPNIVCTQPFGCLPNHIVGKGMIRKLKDDYPFSNIVAIDYDPGATKINQENRIKLMLANAKGLARQEAEKRAAEGAVRA